MTIPAEAQNEIMDRLMENMRISSDDVTDILLRYNVSDCEASLQRAYRKRVGQRFFASFRDEEGRREILAVRNDRGGMDYVLVDACGDVKALQSIQDRMQRQIGGISASQDKVRERMHWFQRFRRVRK